MTTHKTYGELLREARRAKGWTLDRLASEVKLSVSYLADVERERRDPLAPQVTMELEVLLGMSDNRLLDARARHEKRSTLPLGLRVDQDALALDLARQWASLSHDTVRRIAAALEGQS